RIRSLILDPDRAHLVPFNTTNREQELALRFGIPMYGADPKFFPLGTKSGCREIFMEENVPHPLGVENLSSKEELIGAIAQMRAKKPSIKQVLVKLNEGVSGEGNAVIDLSGLPSAAALGKNMEGRAPASPTHPASQSSALQGKAVRSEKGMLEERLRAMQFELAGVTYDSYMKKLQEREGVVEERILGDEIRNPSVELRIT